MSEDLRMYAAIGRFNAVFENMSFAMDHAIDMTIDAPRPNEIAILLARLGFAAKVESLAAVLSEHTDSDVTKRPLILELLNRATNLNKHRNGVIHSLWFPAAAAHEKVDDRFVQVSQHRSRRAGLTVKTEEKRSEELHAFTREADSLTTAFLMLGNNMAALSSDDRGIDDGLEIALREPPPKY